MTDAAKQLAQETARQSQKTASAAGAVSRSADRSTQLAADRTVLAAERTYAAWVRTGLGSLASGIGARALLRPVAPAWIGMATGTVLILFSAFCFVAGVWRDLSPLRDPPQPDTRKLPAAVLVAVNGFLVLVDLAALVGVLFGTGGK